jgi:hypothetical protein
MKRSNTKGHAAHEAREALKDIAFRNRVEKARESTEVLREMAAVGREASVPSDEMAEIIVSGLHRIADDLFPNIDPSQPRRLLNLRRDRKSALHDTSCPGMNPTNHQLPPGKCANS